MTGTRTNNQPVRWICRDPFERLCFCGLNPVFIVSTPLRTLLSYILEMKAPATYPSVEIQFTGEEGARASVVQPKCDYRI